MSNRYGAIIHPQDWDARWLELMQAAGLNVLGLHPVGGHQADIYLRDLIEEARLPERRALYEQARSMGIDIEYEMHALSYLLPRRIFGAHPEWFRMDERGERVADFNFCASSEAALRYIADRAELLALALPPTTDRYYFWLDDVTGYGCHCPECSRLTPSDQQLLAANAILDGIRRVNPKGKLAYLAYQDALNVPRIVKPSEGIFLEYAPIGRDSFKALDDAECPQNAAQAEPIDALLDFFGRKDSQVLEYWVDNSRFSGWQRPPKRMTLAEDVMRADVAFYRSKGFESLTSFACYLGADYESLYGEPPVRRYGEILRGM